MNRSCFRCNRTKNTRNVIMDGVLVAVIDTSGRPSPPPYKYIIQVVTPSGLNCTLDTTRRMKYMYNGPTHVSHYDLHLKRNWSMANIPWILVSNCSPHQHHINQFSMGQYPMNLSLVHRKVKLFKTKNYYEVNYTITNSFIRDNLI